MHELMLFSTSVFTRLEELPASASATVSVITLRSF